MKRLLLLVLVLAAALRVFGLGTYGYWTDELCSMSDAMGWGLQLDQVPLDRPVPQLPVCTRLSTARPLTDVIPGVSRSDVHPPLYFVVLRLWIDCFGDSEPAARSLSVVASLLWIAVLFFVVRETAGAAVAIRAALISAVAVSSIQFAQEVRNYGPAVTLTVVAAWAVIRVDRLRTIGSAVVFGVALLALTLTHYYTVAPAAAMCGHAVITFRGRSRRLAVAAAAVAAGVYLVSWGPSLLDQLHHLKEHAYWLDDDGPGRLYRLLERLCRLPVRYVVDTETFGLPTTVTAVVGAAMLLALPVIYVRRPTLRLWVLLAAAPMVEIALFDLVGRTAGLSWVRYSVTASPAVFVLIAAAVPNRRWTYVPTAVAVIASLASLRTAYSPVWKVADLGAWAQVVGRMMRPGDGLVIAGSDPIKSSINFAAFQHYMSATPDPSVVLTAPASATTLDRFRPCGQIFVLWEPKERRLDQLLPGFVPESVDGIPNVVTFYRGRFTARTTNTAR